MLSERLPSWLTDLTLSQLLVAVLAGAAGVVGSFAVSGISPAFVGAPISGFMAKVMPGEVITFAILVLGSLGQKLNLLSATVAAGAMFAVLALGGRILGGRASLPFVGTAVGGVGAGLVTLLLTGDTASAGAAGLATAAVVVGADSSGVFAERPGGVDAGRRELLGALPGLAAAGAAGGVLSSRRESQTSSRPPEPDALAGGDDETPSAQTATATATPHSGTETTTTPAPGTPGEGETTGTPVTTATATPTPESEIDRLLNEAERKSLGVKNLEPLVSSKFYEVDINAVNPEVSVNDWSLSFTGAVGDGFTMDYDDLTSRPAENRFSTLRCVGERLNGKKMDTSLWTGVPMDTLLDRVAPQSDCDCVMVRAVDGYYEEFPLEALRDGMLAYGMNGQVLPKRHGYPVRLLVPGHWGEINVKWIDEIEFLNEEQKGFWEEKGWHGTGPVNTVAKIHAINRLGGGEIQVGGHTYAGTRGIQRVEVSTDGGETWTDATLSEELPGEDVWRQWEHTYEAPSGEHDVVVRATDGTGTLQPKKESKPFPSGPTGWVSQTIRP
jgi:hypothetical protein